MVLHNKEDILKYIREHFIVWNMTGHTIVLLEQITKMSANTLLKPQYKIAMHTRCLAESNLVVGIKSETIAK